MSGKNILVNFGFQALFAVFFVFIATVEMVSQYGSIKMPKISVPLPGEYDTVAFKAAYDRAQRNIGFPEKEIDPAEYIVGPGDVLTVSIIALQPIQTLLSISAEGKLLVPGVGIISVRGKTLAEVEELVRLKVNGTFRKAETSVALHSPRSFKLFIGGAVRNPSTVVATSLDRVTEVIERVGGLTATASLRRITIFRKSDSKDATIDLQKFFAFDDKSSNPLVQGGDNIFVPIQDERSIVESSGDVSSPGEFEFLNGDKLSTLIQFSNGVLSSARLDSIEIARPNFASGNVDRFYVDASGWTFTNGFPKKLTSDFDLRAGDQVFVRSIPKFLEKSVVTLTGEVRYPGRYAITKNTTRLKDVIDRAGGFTDDAGLGNAVLIRQSEMRIVDREMDRLWRTPPSEMTDNELNYFRARVKEIPGAMSVDLSLISSNTSDPNNVILRDKDSLFVPISRDYVNVTGRVNRPGRIVFKSGWTPEDYLKLAGGIGFRADESAIFVVKSKGQQFSAGDSKLKIEPGDNILVPDLSDKDFGYYFKEALTVATQLITIIGVVLTVVRLR